MNTQASGTLQGTVYHAPAMEAVVVVRSPIPSDRPPVVLVHGAANSSAVWRFWQEALALQGWSSYAVDLRGHGRSPGSVEGALMSDYADDVMATVERLPATPVVMGWSMGGLVAMMVAAQGRARAVVALAPSRPVAERDEHVVVRPGTFGLEEYGVTSKDPAEQPSMPDLDLEERAVALGAASAESRAARDDRKAGIVIASLPCPLLVVTGSEDRSWPRSAYAGMHLPAEYMESCGASHWGLVLNRRLLPALVDRVARWLSR